jgi:hypothetical protein
MAAVIARAERLAQNQALCRSVNEEIETLNKAFDAGVGIGGKWICECADASCTVMVDARLDEYEAVRANPRRFIVYPGHVYPEVERVVRGNERYTVVEKLAKGAEVADATYPRGPVSASGPRRARGAA